MVTTATLDILDANYTDHVNQYLSMDDEFRYSHSKEGFILDPTYWEKYYKEIKQYNCSINWREFKFDSRPDLNVLIPTNEIGLYLFIIKPPNLVFDLPKYVIYVGISGEDGSNRPLKERLNDYFNFNKVKKRKKLHRLLKKYYGEAYVAYSTVTCSWQDLEKLEMSLHGFFMPIANSRDFPVEIKIIKDAF